jgi:hypothetical protein
MTENHIAQECAFTLKAATDEPAFPSNLTAGAEPNPLPPCDAPFSFATEGEEDAYWAGVSDGMRNDGREPPPRLAARARDRFPELVATADQIRDRDILDFDPVSLRHRADGWTPAKQREYVEALADSGVARYAAARVGMSEQSANRLRRRASARSFDRACDAAIRIGARRLISVACERAIDGTIKRHYYRGEVKGEERVYDNRLLIALISKLGPLIAPPPEDAEPPAADWEPWMDALEQGLPEPPPSEPAAAEPAHAPDPDALPDDVEEEAFDGSEIWEERGEWFTDFPPPDGFEGEENGEFGDSGYYRSLSEAEQAVVDANAAEELAQHRAEQCARRDLYFGFAGEGQDSGSFAPRGPELYEPSEPSGAASGQPAGVEAQSGPVPGGDAS